MGDVGAGVFDRAVAIAKSENAKLAFAALAAGVLTASSIFGFQATSRRHRQQDRGNRAQQPESVPHDTFHREAAGGNRRGVEMSEDLIREQLSRNYLFFGEEGMSKIRDSFVVVVGVGGVGSWATTMLVRSGVGRVRIIDFDQVTLSSLNRHAVATLADVGIAKVTALENYLASVAPWISIDARNALFQKSDADELLQPWTTTLPSRTDNTRPHDSRRPDFVIDAIDNIQTKSDLLAYCHNNAIPVISSMGAGCKSDPTAIHLSDISETFEDPLSRAVRRELKLRDITTGIPTVYSTEKPGPGKASLEPLPADRVSGRDEYGILPDFRSRILPVLGTMPALFGLTLTTYILTHLAQYPSPPLLTRSKHRTALYASAFKDLSRGLPESDRRVPLTLRDVEFLMEEVSNGKSTLPPHFPQKLTLVKLHADKAIGVGNCIVVTKEEAREHERRVLCGGEGLLEVYGVDGVKCIELVLERGRELQRYRDGRTVPVI